MKRIGLGLLLGGLSTQAYGGSDIGTENACGLGAVLGQPTGLSGKCYIKGRRFGWDALVAYEFYPNNIGALYVHSTAQWHPTELIEEDWGNISWYFGVGPYVGLVSSGITSNSSLFAGVRAPVGINIDFAEYPVQAFVELAVSVNLFPSTARVAPGGGIGARYYF